MKVLVCGGRDFFQKSFVDYALLLIEKDITTIVHGAARGADSLAGTWAIENGKVEESYKPDTSIDGPWPGAGNRRNQRMFDCSKPDLIIAFPGGPGTANMVKIGRKAGTPTFAFQSTSTVEVKRFAKWYWETFKNEVD